MSTKATLTYRRAVSREFEVAKTDSKSTQKTQTLHGIALNGALVYRGYETTIQSLPFNECLAS